MRVLDTSELRYGDARQRALMLPAAAVISYRSCIAWYVEAANKGSETAPWRRTLEARADRSVPAEDKVYGNPHV